MEFEFAWEGAGTVEAVADDGTVQAERMRGMDAELVGASGEGKELNAGEAGGPNQYAPTGDADFSLHRVEDLIGAAVGVESERQLDHSLVAGYVAGQQRLIRLFDASDLELIRQMTVSLRSQCQHHQSRGVHVQSMDRRLFDAVGNQLPEIVDHGHLVERTASGDRQHAATFVHDDDHVVTVDDVETWRHWSTPQSMNPSKG